MRMNWKQLDRADPARTFALSDAHIHAICRECGIATAQINDAVARTRLSRMLIPPALLALSMPAAKYAGALVGIGLISASLVVLIRQVAALWLMRRFTRAVRQWVQAHRSGRAIQGKSNEH